MPFAWTPNPYPHSYQAGLGPYADEIAHTDEEIHNTVTEALHYDAWLDSSNVHVAVQDGAVTLTGTVPTLYQKSRAADDAWLTPGVRDVFNDLVIRP